MRRPCGCASECCDCAEARADALADVMRADLLRAPDLADMSDVCSAIHERGAESLEDDWYEAVRACVLARDEYAEGQAVAGLRAVWARMVDATVADRVTAAIREEAAGRLDAAAERMEDDR